MAEAKLVIRDAQNRIILDADTALVKLAPINVGRVTTPGSVSIAALTAAGGTVVPIVRGVNNAIEPNVSISGSTLSWSRNNGANFDAVINVLLV